MKHDSFIEQAMLLAEKSVQNHRHGAVIVSRNKIIARGYNSRHSFNIKTSQHAEIAAINDLKKNRDHPQNCQMYVVRLGGNDGTKNSKPCIHCQQTIIENGINRVYFSIDGA
jgi:tRNA(Arg) A34 adenosine deaminase TadA